MSCPRRQHNVPGQGLSPSVRSRLGRTSHDATAPPEAVRGTDYNLLSIWIKFGESFRLKWINFLVGLDKQGHKQYRECFIINFWIFVFINAFKIKSDLDLCKYQLYCEKRHNVIIDCPKSEHSSNIFWRRILWRLLSWISKPCLLIKNQKYQSFLAF